MSEETTYSGSVDPEVTFPKGAPGGHLHKWGLCREVRRRGRNPDTRAGWKMTSRLTHRLLKQSVGVQGNPGIRMSWGQMEEKQRQRAEEGPCLRRRRWRRVWSQSLCATFFFIEVQLIGDVVLISALQQSDSVIHIYTFFLISFPLWFITGY